MSDRPLLKVGDKVHTRDGLTTGRVLATDYKNQAWTVVAAVLGNKFGSKDRETIWHRMPDGRYLADKDNDDLDLIRAPVLTSKFRNVYENCSSSAGTFGTHNAAVQSDKHRASLGVLEFIYSDGQIIDTKFHRSSIG